VEPIGIVLLLLLLAVALWGVRVAVTIIFGCRAVPLWLRGLVTLIISGVLAWMLDSQSFGEMMRRTLGLLDVGLIIAMGDGIARATCWIDDQIGDQPTAPSRRQEPATVVMRTIAQADGADALRVSSAGCGQRRPIRRER
jgi:hypothetical protein